MWLKVLPEGLRGGASRGKGEQVGVNLLDFDREKLGDFCESLGEKRFRASQLMRWIHQRGVSDWAQMTDISAAFRVRLAQEAHIGSLSVRFCHESEDGTIKWLFDVGEGNAVEAVFIPEPDRGTLCISSQAGCAMGCRFCSTGHQGFGRNLSTGEIVAQLRYAEFFLRARFAREERVITNVVMMGMGEPLQNYHALIPALKVMLDDFGYGLSRRRVTVSTSGLVPMIRRLREDCPVALAISLHAPDDALRDVLVPLNRKHPIGELLQACSEYLERAPRDFVTIEYCMLGGVNDSEAHAQALVRLLKGKIRCKLNLIPFNPFPASGLKRSNPAQTQRFAKILLDAGLVTTTRKTRGDDIAAACGQLAGQVRDRTRVHERMVVLHELVGG